MWKHSGCDDINAGSFEQSGTHPATFLPRSLPPDINVGRIPIVRNRQLLQIVSHCSVHWLIARLETSSQFGTSATIAMAQSSSLRRLQDRGPSLHDHESRLENILSTTGNRNINQYQLSWLIFIGLVVMISACQESNLVKRGRPGFDSLMESFLFA